MFLLSLSSKFLRLIAVIHKIVKFSKNHKKKRIVIVMEQKREEETG